MEEKLLKVCPINSDLERMGKIAKSIAAFEYETKIRKYKRKQPLSLKRICLESVVNAVNKMKRRDEHALYVRWLECYGHIDMPGICVTYYTRPPGLVIYRSHGKASRLVQDLSDPKIGVVQLMPQTCVPHRDWPCSSCTIEMNGKSDAVMQWYRERYALFYYNQKNLEEVLQLQRGRSPRFNNREMCSICRNVHTAEEDCLMDDSDPDLEIRFDNDGDNSVEAQLENLHVVTVEAVDYESAQVDKKNLP